MCRRLPDATIQDPPISSSAQAPDDGERGNTTIPACKKIHVAQSHSLMKTLFQKKPLPWETAHMRRRGRLTRWIGRLALSKVALHHGGSPGDHVTVAKRIGPDGLGRDGEFSGRSEAVLLTEVRQERQLGSDLPMLNVDMTVSRVGLFTLWNKAREERGPVSPERWTGLVIKGLPCTKVGLFQHVVTDSLR
jgi:hypothetical protein